MLQLFQKILQMILMVQYQFWNVVVTTDQNYYFMYIIPSCFVHRSGEAHSAVILSVWGWAADIRLRRAHISPAHQRENHVSICNTFVDRGGSYSINDLQLLMFEISWKFMGEKETVERRNREFITGQRFGFGRFHWWKWITSRLCQKFLKIPTRKHTGL